MDLQMLPWASALTKAGYLVDHSAQQCTPTSWVCAYIKVARSPADMLQAPLSRLDTSPLEDVVALPKQGAMDLVANTISLLSQLPPSDVPLAPALPTLPAHPGPDKVCRLQSEVVALRD